MKALDRVVAVLILLLGVVHIGAGLVLRGRPDLPGMWFLSGGLMMMFLALLNLVRSSSGDAVARRAALVANLLALPFVAGLALMMPLRPNPQVLVIVGLVAAATAFSIARR